MANYKSSAKQAIKDMLESGLDITFFIGELRHLHKLNTEIGIESKPVKIKLKVEVTVNVNIYVPDNRMPLPKRRTMFNPDGTVAVFMDDDWDNK